MILAIDPGNTESGWVLFDGERVQRTAVSPNHGLLRELMDTRPGATFRSRFPHACTLAIEMMRARGMPTSNDEFETLVWIGRFQQAWHDPEAVRLVYRADVKMQVCGNGSAKDANIRQALLDLVGPTGTRKAPGLTFGVKSHAWAALGVAVTALAQLKGEEK